MENIVCKKEIVGHDKRMKRYTIFWNTFARNKDVVFLVFLRCLFMRKNQNSPKWAQTVDFFSCYTRKTAKICRIICF